MWLHPFWIHFVIIYYMNNWIDLTLDKVSQRLLFDIEAQLLNGSLTKMITIQGFKAYL
jgi:hypothetical protein